MFEIKLNAKFRPIFVFSSQNNYGYLVFLRDKAKKITFLLYLSSALARCPLGHTFFPSTLDAEFGNKDLEMVYI